MLEERVWTADDLLTLDEPGWCHEIIRGDLRRMTGPGWTHGRITMRLGARIDAFAESTGLGITLAAETGFILERNPDTVRCPDVAFVRRERVPDIWTRGHLEGAPDLVVEVASPNDSFAWLHDKMLQWMGSGAAMGWLVEPERARVNVYRRNDAGGFLVEVLTDGVLRGGDVLPGFELPLAELFAPPR
ncbi:MAG: Uma2 family endonuclease [Planctomycetes bacterium]|nr:Uma2 family endonuclease [Planctomycetota bacterium]